MAKALRQPQAAANTGMASGVMMAPAVLAAFIAPKATDRSLGANRTATDLTNTGVPIASAAPSATRNVLNTVIVRAAA
jgi:hypothetical protein